MLIVACAMMCLIQVLITSHGQLETCWLDAARSAAAGQLLVKSGRQSSRARQQAAASTAAERQLLQQQQQQAQDLLADRAAVADGGESGAQSAASSETAAQRSTASPGQPLRVPGLGIQAGPHTSCGWVFHEQDVFDQALLLQLLQAVQPSVGRLKGVFRTAAKQWVMPVEAPAGQDTRQQLKADAQHQQQQQHGEAVCAGGAAPAVLQLQPVCYRGPSMVEVIITLNDSKLQAATNAATTTAQLHSMLWSFITGRHAVAENHPSSNTQGSETLIAGVNFGAHDESDIQNVWRLLEEALTCCLKNE